MRKKVLCRVLITFLWVLALTIPAFAQTKTISGIISDQTGVPLLKATIKVKGEKIVWSYFKIPLSTLKLWFNGSPFNELSFRIKGPEAQDELFYFDDILLVK